MDKVNTTQLMSKAIRSNLQNLTEVVYRQRDMVDLCLSRVSRSSGDTIACSGPHAPRFKMTVYSTPVPLSSGRSILRHT